MTVALSFLEDKFSENAHSLFFAMDCEWCRGCSCQPVSFSHLEIMRGFTKGNHVLRS